MINQCSFCFRLLALVLISTIVGNCYITNKPVDTEVVIGDSTYLNCSISESSAGVISWFHYPVGKTMPTDLRYVYAEGIVYSLYEKRYKIEKDNSTGAFNLIITHVESQDAGLYVCQNGGGTDQSNVKAELIVLESIPDCISNINDEGIIGPNSCGLQKEAIQFFCSIIFNGNIAPKIEWTNDKDKSLSSNFQFCNVSEGRMICSNKMMNATDLDGDFFICQTPRSKNAQYSCKTEPIRMLYAMDNKTRVAKTIGDVMTCPSKPDNLGCDYTWIWYDVDHQETMSENGTLIISKDGLHRCEAKCKLKGFQCNFVSMAITASTASVEIANTATILGSVLIIISICFILIAVGFFIKVYFLTKKRRKCKCDILKAQMEEFLIGSGVQQFIGVLGKDETVEEHMDTLAKGVTGINRKNRSSLMNPDVESTRRHVDHCDEMPISVSEELPNISNEDFTSGEECEEEVDLDNNALHLFHQEELNYLVRCLNFKIRKSQLPKCRHSLPGRFAHTAFRPRPFHPHGISPIRRFTHTAFRPHGVSPTRPFAPGDSPTSYNLGVSPTAKGT